MKKITLLAICILSCVSVFAQKYDMSNIKIDTIYYDKQWKAAMSPLFADFYRLAMSDASNPQAGYKVRDYFITGELQGEGSCIQLGVDDDAKTVWEGKVVTYFKNGKLSSERVYENGKLNGDAISYYESGLIETKVPYSKGLKNGLALIFTNDGAKCKKVEYLNGELKNDYYELVDYEGYYSKFYHKDDKIKWESPTAEDRKLAFSNGAAFYYYENNGLTVAVHMTPVLDYGKYFKFNVVISNNSCEAVEVKPSNIVASFKYTEGANTKVDQIKLHILSYVEYENKIRKKQNAQKVLVGFANGLAASQAGYSATSAQINSGYVGISSNRNAYIGVSSTNVTSVSYDGYAAYQASMMANAQYNAMSKEMIEERTQKVDAYLKDNTVFPGKDVDGYFLIPMDIKSQKQFGGELVIDFVIAGATYKFITKLPSQKEVVQMIRSGEVNTKDFRRLQDCK